MKAEVGKRYKSKQTGLVYRVTERILFNTCVVLEREREEHFCLGDIFIENFKEVKDST